MAAEAAATTTGTPGITIGTTEGEAGRIITITTEGADGREAGTREAGTGSTETEESTGVGRGIEVGL